MNKEHMQLGRQITILTGPEGSGKTTIAKMLATFSHKPYFTVGDILRDLAENDQTEYGDECRTMFRDHRYLNPQMLLDILAQRLSRNDLAEGFISDGGLRTVQEVGGFQSVLERSDRIMPLSVVHLRIPGWMSVQRLMARKRGDDTIGGVLNRLSNHYHNLGQRTAMIKCQKNWRFLQVDATGTIEETFDNICWALTTGY